MTLLPARQAYRLWADHYEEETAVSFLEDRAVAALGPAASGRRVLDAGCGTGRRLRAADAALGVGVDLSPEMLLAGGPGLRATGDLRALPVRAAAFDVVWCRLAVGHLAELAAAYRELARACRPGGAVVVTDFHPAAAAAGHRRTFRDAAGALHEVEHHVHLPTAHAAAAAAAGLLLRAGLSAAVGPAVRPFYARAGRLDAYRRQAGLPLVLALRFERLGPVED